MHITVKNLLDIENNLKASLNKLNINNYPKIIAVSKTFKIDKILPLIKHGHMDFGENKVQEAIEKWTEIKKNNSEIKLHMIGKLQTNKVKFAVKLFDYIHSVDSEKLAKSISLYQEKKKFKPKVFIQVNIGNEVQKGGINTKDLEFFFKLCVETYNLDVIGLMCIPPNDDNVQEYFKKMKNMKDSLGLKELSMGMSNDYKLAIDNGATFVRIGSKIFGERINQF